MRLAGIARTDRRSEAGGKVQARLTITAPIGGVSGAHCTAKYDRNGWRTAVRLMDYPPWGNPKSQRSAAQVRPGSRGGSTPVCPARYSRQGERDSAESESADAHSSQHGSELANPGRTTGPGQFATVTLAPAARKRIAGALRGRHSRRKRSVVVVRKRRQIARSTLRSVWTAKRPDRDPQGIAGRAEVVVSDSPGRFESNSALDDPAWRDAGTGKRAKGRCYASRRGK